MANEVTQPKTLQERVAERMRDQIADLMTADDLKALVDKAMNDAFFTSTPLPKRNWNDAQEYGDSFAVKHVKALMKERVDAACAAWLAEHKDQLGKHIDEAVGKGFSALFQQWLDEKVRNDLFNFGQGIKQSLGIRS
jgi:hypothetical protein